MSEVTRRVSLCLPVVLACAVDCGLTLSGQPDTYWTRRGAPESDGGTSAHSYPPAVNEVNPALRILLTWHPLIYLNFWLREEVSRLQEYTVTASRPPADRT